MFHAYPPKYLEYRDKQVLLVSKTPYGLEKKVLLRDKDSDEKIGGLFSVEGELFVVRRGASFLYYNYQGKLEKEVVFRDSESVPEDDRRDISKSSYPSSDVSPSGSKIVTLSVEGYWGYTAKGIPHWDPEMKGVLEKFHQNTDNQYFYSGFQMQFLTNDLILTYNDEMLIVGDRIEDPEMGDESAGVRDVRYYYPMYGGRVLTVTLEKKYQVSKNGTVKILKFERVPAQGNTPSEIRIVSEETVGELKGIEDMDAPDRKIELSDKGVIKYSAVGKREGEEETESKEVCLVTEGQVLRPIKCFERQLIVLSDGTHIRDPKVPTVPVIRSERDKAEFARVTPLARVLSDVIHAFLVGEFKVGRDFLIASDVKSLLAGKVADVLIDVINGFWIRDLPEVEEGEEE